MNEAVPFLQLVVTAMVPYILAAQGTMLAGRAGVFNYDHRPAVSGWLHAAVGRGQVPGPPHAQYVTTRLR